MVHPATTTETLLQQIATSNAEILALLRQGQGQDQVDASASDAPSPAPDAASQARRPAKKTAPRRGKRAEVRGD